LANLMDYLTWRGEFGFDVTPWNDVDALIMANVCYLDFHGTDDARGWTLAEAKRLELVRATADSGHPARRAQFEAMADTARFGDVRMHHFMNYLDDKTETQFSATCYDMPDGTLCVAFRGTDGTFVGWKEDFNMSYESPVPAQEAAVYYLERVTELDDRPIRLVGHSKGGNLAAYAAACASEKTQERLEAIYSFDGPGFDPEVFGSEGYARVVDRIHSLVPQTSIVGMLMEYHRNYTVVKSSATGIAQHDPMTWQVIASRFETVPEIDENAQMISDTLHQWLEKSNREERAKMVEALFEILGSAKLTNVGDVRTSGGRSLWMMLTGAYELDPESWKNAMRLIRLFLSLGFGNMADRRLAAKTQAKDSQPEETSETFSADPAQEGASLPEGQENKRLTGIPEE